ncbi:NrdH-like glutaredoxin [Microbacterium phage Fede]|nr:NrdH-like glutaredoxin [Microbacterium phage Fede]
MNTPITVWTKPSCVQCNMVKKFLVEKFTGKRNLSPGGLEDEWQDLIRAGKVRELDLSSPDHIKDLEHFKGLGYGSAPITEYKSHAVPGFIPAQLATIFEEYQHEADPARS